jgi:cytidyltransferase-like protein
MILETDQLKKYRGKVAMVDGAFDPLHHGHIAYFRKARELGVPLLCNIAPDSYVSQKHPPLLDASRRAQVIDALADIDYTHVSTTATETVLRQLHPTHYVKGKDWEGRLPPEQEQICAEQGTEIVLLDTVLDSSTQLLQRWTPGAGNGDGEVVAFERLVSEQRPVEAEHYDSDYFVSDWREGQNDYTIEARRKIEGKHPQVIKRVFQPDRVLDVGCGPGALLFLLQEQGILADGVDFSPSVRSLAPEEVRERLIIGTTSDASLFADNSYDLVICREVMEHLTVLQVRDTVRNLCRISSRYVYVTTRFHPEPAGLLDVTTQFEVDPSHITLLNKDFLRVMFVLEGFRRRQDLESTIDWMGKGRVLVYEKQEGVA